MSHVNIVHAHVLRNIDEFSYLHQIFTKKYASQIPLFRCFNKFDSQNCEFLNQNEKKS